MAKTWREQAQELMSKCYDILETLEDYDMTGDENGDIKSYYKDLNELRDSETDLLDADYHAADNKELTILSKNSDALTIEVKWTPELKKFLQENNSEKNRGCVAIAYDSNNYEDSNQNDNEPEE